MDWLRGLDKASIARRLVLCLHQIAAEMEAYHGTGRLLAPLVGDRGEEQIRLMAREVYGTLARMGLDFVPNPSQHPTDFDAGQYVNQMWYFAAMISAADHVEFNDPAHPPHSAPARGDAPVSESTPVETRPDPVPPGQSPESPGPSSSPQVGNPGQPIGTSPAQPSRREPDGVGYLAISVDERKRKIARTCYETPVHFGGQKLHWQLMMTFLKAGDDIVDKDQLRSVWDEAGLSDDPQPRTVTDAIAKLRMLIAPLGLQIKNDRGLGYRLTEKD
jgi:hypothetical protein